ncbi:unnamed protein product [Miscanthus lutarioriparius]|uniref:HVA22-like protein n=1 Tax=Miscanthus lutarioriparius TaxID=422564 RepID=A0A811SJJ3_9POAL|nr:unnamed protein product [Miscanthus lutarioriparius]
MLPLPASAWSLGPPPSRARTPPLPRPLRSAPGLPWSAGGSIPPHPYPNPRAAGASVPSSPGLKMIGSFITGVLTLVLGYAYPAYDCYKTVELNRPEAEQLRFWCQYWFVRAPFRFDADFAYADFTRFLTVLERVGESFVSWLPMYSEAKLAFIVYLWYPKTRPYIAKHETEIDRNLLELSTRAGDMVVLYYEKVANYDQPSSDEILQYIASQSESERSRPQHEVSLAAILLRVFGCMGILISPMGYWIFGLHSANFKKRIADSHIVLSSRKELLLISPCDFLFILLTNHVPFMIVAADCTATAAAPTTATDSASEPCTSTCSRTIRAPMPPQPAQAQVPPTPPRPPVPVAPPGAVPPAQPQPAPAPEAAATKGPQDTEAMQVDPPRPSVSGAPPPLPPVETLIEEAIQLTRAGSGGAWLEDLDYRQLASPRFISHLIAPHWAGSGA